MNTLALIGIVVATIIIISLGGGGFYLFWLRTRQKKETWNAKIYQLSSGIRKPLDQQGRLRSDINLQDLRPYALDTLEKVEKDHGITIYRLQKLNKVTPPVDSASVDYWGEGKKEVSLVLIGDSLTILKKGYDKESGEMIFDPMPHDRVNIIKSETAIRKERHLKEKDIVAAITPWVMMGIMVFAVLGNAYISGSAAVKISENNKAAAQNYAKVCEGAKLTSQSTKNAEKIQKIQPGSNNNQADKLPTITG